MLSIRELIKHTENQCFQLKDNKTIRKTTAFHETKNNKTHIEHKNKNTKAEHHHKPIFTDPCPISESSGLLKTIVVCW
jgi:hypothetical protein